VTEMTSPVTPPQRTHTRRDTAAKNNTHMPKKGVAADPRNEAWARDHSRFGFVMLQRMGWKDGEGLGPEGRAKGRTSHINVVRRPDNRGVGASLGAGVGEWAQGAQALSSVLERLAKSCTPPPPPPSPSPSPSVNAPQQHPVEGRQQAAMKRRGAGRMLNMRNVRAKLAKRTKEEIACVLPGCKDSAPAVGEAEPTAGAEETEAPSPHQEVGPTVVSAMSSTDYFRIKLQKARKQQQPQEGTVTVKA